MANRIPKVWLAANVIGIATFLYLASFFWIEPELADVPGASGGAFIGWALFAAPVALVFGIANLGWLMVTLFRLRRREWFPSICAMAMLAAWYGAYLFDNAHHGI